MLYADNRSNHGVKQSRFIREKAIMKPRNSLVYILAALITLPLFGTAVHATTIDIIQTLDFPGEGTSTLPQKISDQIVDALGVTHGLFYVTPDDILTYDYPGSTYTSLNGINKDGLICGYYGDAAGIFHGFVASVNLEGASKPNTSIPGAPVKPVRPLPEMLRIGAPAL